VARWSAARAGPTKPETTVWPSERVAVKGRRVGGGVLGGGVGVAVAAAAAAAVGGAGGGAGAATAADEHGGLDVGVGVGSSCGSRGGGDEAGQNQRASGAPAAAARTARRPGGRRVAFVHRGFSLGFGEGGVAERAGGGVAERRKTKDSRFLRESWVGRRLEREWEMGVGLRDTAPGGSYFRSQASRELVGGGEKCVSVAGAGGETKDMSARACSAAVALSPPPPKRPPPLLANA